LLAVSFLPQAVRQELVQQQTRKLLLLLLLPLLEKLANSQN
jgi:hypothetical protein